MALREQQGVAGNADECATALEQLSRSAEPRSTYTALHNAAEKSRRFLEDKGGSFSSMLETVTVLPVSRVDISPIRRWFGEVKEFPDVDLLVQIVSIGAPVAVGGRGDLVAALHYGNHSSVRPSSSGVLAKIQNCGGRVTWESICFSTSSSRRYSRSSRITYDGCCIPVQGSHLSLFV